MVIIGGGADKTIIDGNRLDRALDLADPSHNGISVQLNNLTVRGGLVAASGGGIYVQGQVNLTVTDVRVTGNASSGDEGGGIGVQDSATVRIFQSTIDHNTALTFGGGIASNGNLTVGNSTVSDNSVSNGAGGGIYSNKTTNLNNTTVAYNTSNQGGGVSVAAGTGFSLKNSLIANNNSGAGDCNGMLTSQGYNLIGTTDAACIFVSTMGDQSNIAANLGPLQNNGGPTPTCNLLSGSPAIDAGNPGLPGSGNNTCLLTDQRGVTRPQDGNHDGNAVCDIGAYEASGYQIYLPNLFR